MKGLGFNCVYFASLFYVCISKSIEYFGNGDHMIVFPVVIMMLATFVIGIKLSAR